MALYAFDGTGNENQPDDARDTNVLKFYEAYNAAKPGGNLYIPGVGTRWGFVGKFFGGVFGMGGFSRLRKAYKTLEKNFANGDKDIDIVGFSRGAALALGFANKIKKKGAPGEGEANIRFVGLWDTVASFGIPGNKLNIGHPLRLPDNVEKCCHALSLDERRGTFPVHRQEDDAKQAHVEGRITEVWFRGVHSDIGGGNTNTALSSITLHWMMEQAKGHGVPLSDDAVAKYARMMNPKARIKPAAFFDPIKDPFREVLDTDLVHHTVEHRDKDGDLEHKNPHPGVTRVRNDGTFVT